MFKHPELREGEVFLGNITEAMAMEAGEFLPYSTLRLGEKPYDIDTGNPGANGFVPVFVGADELEMRGRYLVPIPEVEEAIAKLRRKESFHIDLAAEISENFFMMLAVKSGRAIFRHQQSPHHWFVQP